MTPETAIAMLDRALARAGTTVKLRRIFPGSPPAWSDVDVRMLIRSPSEDWLTAGFKQTDSMFIMSLSQIQTAGWPGGASDGTAHPELPRSGAGGDKIFQLGTPRQIEAVKPIEIDGDIVRVEGMMKGPATAA